MQNKAGDWIGPETQSPWLRPHPPGFRKLLKWTSDRYGRPVIYVTENGTSVKGENSLSRDEIVEDEFRVWYFTHYIRAMGMFCIFRLLERKKRKKEEKEKDCREEEMRTGRNERKGQGSADTARPV